MSASAAVSQTVGSSALVTPIGMIPAVNRDFVPQRPVSTGSIALVAAPFNSFRRPSIQIGLLASIARAAGWQTRTHHLFLDFAVMVGVDLYERIANDRDVAVGDWLFSVAAFGNKAPDPSGDALISHFELRDATALKHIRSEVVPAYIQLAAAEIARSRPQIVGFTSTFQQTIASLALAKAVKALLPTTRLLFGGANFEYAMAMEWLKQVDEVELVLSGEADDSLPLLLAALSQQTDLAGVPGLAWRDVNGLHQNAPAPLVDNLDRNPVPDYTEYMARANYLGLLKEGMRNDIRIPFESARGCWWGESQHCIFCGLNATSMQFRAKSAEKVLAELGELAVRHHSYHFEAVDNILDRSYRKTLLPQLTRADVTYDIFYEVKSNLKADELRELAASGIRHIQPGIESLSTPVLKLMRKGVQALHNVNLLRWARHYGVVVNWNVLWGFPGEKAEYYTQQAQLFHWLYHLQPPSAGLRVWLERFSPLYQDKAGFPMHHCRPECSLDYIFPSDFDKTKVAYFFEYELKDALPSATYTSIIQAIGMWKEAWRKEWQPGLVYFSAPDCVTVEDSRYQTPPLVMRYRGREARLIQLLLEKPLTGERVAALLAQPQQWVDRSLRLLVRDGVVAAEGGLYLSLPLPARRP